MLRRFIFVSLLGLILNMTSFAQTGEIYFKFTTKPGDKLDKLTRLVSIDNVKGDTVYAYANDKQFDNFSTLGYDYIILPNPGTLYQPRMSDDRQIILDWDTYPTYDAYVEMMYQFAVDYPALCTVENIGFSVEGREILFAKLSANVDIEEYEPEVMYSGTMHGDETTGYILLFRLIDYMLSNYGIDPQITDILNNMEIWINPLANPDGTYYGGNNSVFGARRYNANNYDLNRNFPDPDEGQHPGGTWQPETIAMMDFFDEHSFAISANFHGGAEVVNYPWDTWPQRHADDIWYIDICREYADSAQDNSPYGYMTDLNNGITNGWDWYEVVGGRQDYLNFWKGCRETTIELSHTKLLPENQLDDHWNYNRAALITYIEQAYYGIRGLVTNASNGQPVSAIISIVGHDIDSSEVYTDPDVGDYYRMIESGTYDLRFTALGYIPLTVYGVTVTDHSATIIDVEMQPLSDEPLLDFYGYDTGIVDAGDTVSMAITLINNGGGDASNVNAVLSTMDNYISMIQPSSAYPDINALGGTGASYTDYVFAVSPSCPSMHRVDFQLDITAADGYSDSAFFSIVVGLNIEDFETGDFSSYPWQMGGNAPWVTVTSNVYEGSYSAKSGTISHNQNSVVMIDYEVAVPGTLSFYYKVSSENNYDYLNFYINNNRQDRWSGEVGWAQASFNVAAGVHNFKWEYEKDYSVSNGSDCAWIDYIIFPATDYFIPGDANGDGEVRTSDVTYLVSYFRGDNPPPEPLLAGDVNGDCEVTVADVIYFVLYFRGTGDPPQIGDCR